MGIEAGVAVARTERVDGAYRTELRTRSADWLAGLYPVDDVVHSVWELDGGSQRYVTRFREGRFQQDQTMAFTVSGIRVDRRQLFAEGWREWSNDYPAILDIEDPLSAVMRLRASTAPEVTLTVFSGKRAIPVRCRDLGAELVEGVSTRKIELAAEKEGVFEAKLTAWFTEDAARLPVRAVVHTKAGPVTIRLVAPPQR